MTVSGMENLNIGKMYSIMADLLSDQLEIPIRAELIQKDQSGGKEEE